MNLFPWVMAGLLFLVAAWFAWRYYVLKQRVNQYAELVRTIPESLPTDLAEIENLSNSIAVLNSVFANQLEVLNSENMRLSTALAQLTDGVLIADKTGQVQYANPAAQRLFNSDNPIGHSVAEVVRNHQLIETWRRSQQLRELQIESVELPARKNFLQLIVIPDKHAGGSLLVVQDLTRVRRLETVRRDFISNVSPLV